MARSLILLLDTAVCVRNVHHIMYREWQLQQQPMRLQYLSLAEYTKMCFYLRFNRYYHVSIVHAYLCYCADIVCIMQYLAQGTEKMLSCHLTCNLTGSLPGVTILC